MLRDSSVCDRSSRLFTTATAMGVAACLGSQSSAALLTMHGQGVDKILSFTASFNTDSVQPWPEMGENIYRINEGFISATVVNNSQTQVVQSSSGLAMNINNAGQYMSIIAPNNLGGIDMTLGSGGLTGGDALAYGMSLFSPPILAGSLVEVFDPGSGARIARETVFPIPEPASLLLGGAAAVGALRRPRREAAEVRI